MGLFDEADRFYKNRSLLSPKETVAKVSKKETSEKNQEKNIAPSSEYDGAFEILGIDVDLPKTKKTSENVFKKASKKVPQTKKRKKMKVPIVNIKPL